MASHENSDRFACACCGQSAPMPGRDFPVGWGDPGGTVRFCVTCALRLEQAAQRDPAVLPIACLHLAIMEVERETRAQSFDDRRAWRHVRVIANRFLRGGTRERCGCGMCRAAVAALGLPRQVQLPPMPELPIPSLRPPVDVSEVSTFVLRTFNPEQRCILPDGSIVTAADAVRFRAKENHVGTTGARPAMPEWLARYYRGILARGPDNTPRDVRAQDDALRKAYWSDYGSLGVDAARLNDVKRRFVSAMWDDFFTPARGYYDWDGKRLWWVEDETGECFDISDILPEPRP